MEKQCTLYNQGWQAQVFRSVWEQQLVVVLSLHALAKCRVPRAALWRRNQRSALQWTDLK